ncbi:MAG: hypothetical protein HY843_01765 [Bdellovibrio sp.]|nr:hypothetical protein [Bdellovibrio sp.]
MRRASVTDLKNHLSEFLVLVKKGDFVRIYDRKEPVADLLPIGHLSASDNETRLLELETKGILRLGREKISDEFLRHIKDIAKKSSNTTYPALDFLLEERKLK